MHFLAWLRDRNRATRTRGAGDELAFDRLTAEIEDGLRAIDFDEVSDEDRATFVEHAVVWQVRRALGAARFDLALELQRWGVERLATIERGRQPFRPRLVVPQRRGRATS